MRVMAHVGMVMNLDKCIGCHTCSVTCKQTWTNRSGVEYVWFNNVETRPGVGYPRGYEDQEKWEGGWERTRKGKLRLKSGGRMKRLASIFANPKLPTVKEYYEPWTYDYDILINSPLSAHMPVAKPQSLLTGKDMQISWSPNWDDDLGGSPEIASADPVLQQMSEKVVLDFENSFMFYLPRICEHCLNPACAAGCPSGAIYKRSEDGIVLVDHEQCRGWRMCVSACPYKKIYFNHVTGKAEKCTMCYPRLEAGQPTVCSETCVGRLRYLGLLLYDADRVEAAASVANEHDLLAAQRDVFLDPHDPEVITAARASGIPDEWLEAARRSPVWRLIKEYDLALPLHPEYRTLPMVWYIPPLSPVVDIVAESGHDGEDAQTLFAAIDKLRIPMEYLAGLFSAGDTGPVQASLQKLAVMRSYMRRVNLGQERDETIAASIGMTGIQVEEMYRLLSIAKYEDRFVVPTSYAGSTEDLAQALAEQGSDLACALDCDGGPGMMFLGSAGQQVPFSSAVTVGGSPGSAANRPSTPGRINLLNWDGKASAEGLFPPGNEVSGQLPVTGGTEGTERTEGTKGTEGTEGTVR